MGKLLKLQLWIAALLVNLTSIVVFAQTAESYGEYVVYKAWSELANIHRQVKTSINFEGIKPTLQESEIIRQLESERLLLPSLHPDVKIRIEFRSGNDPIFKLSENEPARTAVTSSDINDPIFFNLDLINNESFTYAKAISLWLHELGHKIKKPSQFEIDRVASWYERHGHYKEERFKIRGSEDELLLIQHADGRKTMGNAYESDPTIAILKKDKVIPLQNILFAQQETYTLYFDSEKQKMVKNPYIARFINIWVNNIETTKLDDSNYKFLIDFTAGNSEIYEDRKIELGPSQKLVNFFISEKNGNYEFEGIKYVSSIRAKAAPGIRSKIAIDASNISSHKFVLSAEIWGVPNYAYLLNVNRLYVKIDGEPDSLSFNVYPYVDDRMYRKFEVEIVIPEHKRDAKTIEVLGLGGQAYYPQPPVEQDPYQLDYLFPIDEPLILELQKGNTPNASPSQCNSMLNSGSR